ncbi:MAG: FadR family transcriptional regulator [Spirochaetales bacterium]|nr:FadR family transcriptional regulator [Spirochaetales bacterium]
MNFDRIDRKQTLADSVCETITNRIIEGNIPAGEALPTEPELSAQFGVSRAVVRDACRMLMARGLVDILHGKGMFVTGSQERALGEALLTALRRDGAKVWDVEQFEQTWYPEVFVLAAKNMNRELYEEILSELERHLKVFEDLTRRAAGAGRDMTADEREELLSSFHPLLKLIMKATDNRLISLLGLALRRLRNLRNWQGIPEDPESIVRKEREVLYAMVETLRLEDPDQIRSTLKRLMALPPEAVKAMKKTPLGEVVEIRLDGASAG